MNPGRRFLRVLFIFFFIIAFGIAGYMAIEGWPFLDALYMTVITISTVGYAEVHPLSAAGRIFGIILIIVGVGGMLYALTSFVQYFVEGQLTHMLGRHRMKERIANLKDHIILCGYGRVGREVALVFKEEEMPFVIVETEQAALDNAAEDRFLYLQGDATSDEVLNEAGIRNARALVAALGDDADNLYVTLSAKVIRHDLFVVARASSDESEVKLKRAGADRIISPYRIGGRHMAMLTLRPLVVDFVDTTMHSRGREFILENIKVGPGSPALGVMVTDALKCCGALDILAVKKKGGKLLTNPSGEVTLELGDELVVIGTREQLRILDGSA